MTTFSQRPVSTSKASTAVSVGLRSVGDTVFIVHVFIGITLSLQPANTEWIYNWSLPTNLKIGLLFEPGWGWGLAGEIETENLTARNYNR